jgi:Zn-dependent alcohol dehydrogenase
MIDYPHTRSRLGDINEAFRALKAGEVARTALTFD